MFENCKRLSYYTNVDGNIYTIPETFFSYTPNITKLIKTFSGIILPHNVKLNVFGNLSKLSDISRIFEYMYINTDE
jgi:hypothetical protein